MKPARHHPKAHALSRLCLGAALLGASGLASSHDSWFELRVNPSAGPGARLLALGTGNQFPKLETGLASNYLTAVGCAVGGHQASLPALRDDAAALLLRPPIGATSCWMQLQAFDVTVAPDKVPVYLKEINASPELRATWAAMQARGLPWRERYVKHARIDLDDGAPAAAASPAASSAADPPPASSAPASLSASLSAPLPASLSAPLPAQALGMDLRLERQGGPLLAGGTVTAQVLRDGQPLADQALELRSEDSPLGIWRRSDSQGRVSLPLPLAGRWLLRGVDLRVSASDPDRWDSRFVTLAFQVGARPQPKQPPEPTR